MTIAKFSICALAICLGLALLLTLSYGPLFTPRELDSGEISQITNELDEQPQLKPLVKEFLEDGKIDVREFNQFWAESAKNRRQQYKNKAMADLEQKLKNTSEQ